MSRKTFALITALLLTAAVVAQEMNIRGKSVNIADNDASPTLVDNTDFGRQWVASGTVSITYTIQNLGASNLNLTGVPIVVVGGTNAADFTVSTQPVSPVSAGASTTFTVVFNPSAAGTRVATLSIANNDANENPYNFSIQGTGITSTTVKWVNNQGGARPATVVVNGNTYNVSAVTYTTIQTALAAAVSDDIVYVTNGVYRNTNETTSTNCSLFGTAQDLNLYIDLSGKQNITITSETGNFCSSSARLVGYGFNLRSSHGMIFQGLHIDSVRVNAFWNSNCCGYDPSNNIKIINNKISNIRGHGIKTDDGGPTGNSINRGAWEITGNYFLNIGFYNGYGFCAAVSSTAIWLAEAGANYLIANNTISNTNWAGILCTGFGSDPEGQSPSFIMYDGVITISGNRINNTVDAGIQIGLPITGGVFYHPANAIITNNIITNANTSSKVGIGAITLLANNIKGITITNNDVRSSFNGLAIEISGWENSLDTKIINNNNFYNLSGGYGVTHIAGISPNGLFGTGDDLTMYNFDNNYWGAASGPTYSTNPAGTGVGLKKDINTLGAGTYSLNDFDFVPFLATPSSITTVLTCGIALPVELLYFNGQNKDNYNLLTWATASEINNNRFEIERSSDANSFAKIGEVNGAGTSYALNSYEFKDINPLISINYYRLKQVDNAGKNKYSSVVTLKNTSSKLLTIYPNPVTEKLYLNNGENGVYRITTMTGLIVQTGGFNSGYPVNVKDLPQGIYYFQLNLQVVKFIKL